MGADQKTDVIREVGKAKDAQMDLATSLTAQVCHLQEGQTSVTKALDQTVNSFTEKVRLQLKEQCQEFSTRTDQLKEVVQVKETSPVDLTQVQGLMDEKLRSYADVTRQSQTTFYQEQDRERKARQVRSKNLRIVGLPEVEGDDAREVVMRFFDETLRLPTVNIEQAARIGRNERGGRTILVRFGTGESREEVLRNRNLLRGKQIWLDPDLTPIQMEEKKVEMQKVKEAAAAGWVAFLRNGLQNEKKSIQGRGFGGIAIWVRDGLDIETQVERVDKNKQFVCISIKTPRSSVTGFLVVAYFAPWKAPVYSYLDTDIGDPFMELTNTVLELREKGLVWITGDFNRRTGVEQGLELRDEADVRWHREDPISDWVRNSEDVGRNGLSESFTRFVNSAGMTILNGTHRFVGTHHFTCKTPTGASVVDYLLASREARESVLEFSFTPFLPESDHRALCFTISGFSVQRRVKKHRHSQSILLEGTFKEYEQKLAVHLVGRDLSAEEVAILLAKTAKEAFKPCPEGRQSWFDSECCEARRRALAVPEADHPQTFKTYKNLIRAKKRRACYERQLVLQEEFKRNPRSFWGRLRETRPETELNHADLCSYVEKLYFFPEADTMPITSGPGCRFTEEEVDACLRQMALGKAGDLNGLKLEMLRWGGGGGSKAAIHFDTSFQ
ncbi:hypothetical protein R1sor_027224 [Riccia sorocarpa]|uniref:Endonuclease/exonuclease/phosphatase domain-containing protein n=1 Tax=Riccia sorocarpa TaxID=122646 RepID=A0ABD3GHA2_9MARC